MEKGRQPEPSGGVTVLAERIYLFFRILYPEGAVNFVKDNSAVHTAHIVPNYRAQNSYNVIAWPSEVTTPKPY
nr:unnamed protein product [Callosobruchus chinensis]